MSLRNQGLKNNIQRGEVYWVNLPLFDKSEKENIRELQGRHPGLVISNDEQNKKTEKESSSFYYLFSELLYWTYCCW